MSALMVVLPKPGSARAVVHHLYSEGYGGGRGSGYNRPRSVPTGSALCGASVATNNAGQMRTVKLSEFIDQLRHLTKPQPVWCRACLGHAVAECRLSATVLGQVNFEWPIREGA